MASSPSSDAALVGVPWTDGTWTSEPEAMRIHDGGMDVTARAGSDAWRITSYGFVHDTEHALLAPLAPGTAVEVAFTLDLREQFDQAGVFVRVDAETWIKAGVERSDGEDGLGAVVTRGVSDWSLAPVPGWSGRLATIRASRSGDALTVRARVDDEPWRLVRVAPLDPDATASAGPFCCAPTRAGFTARFASWRTGPADAALHA
jgi:regulation of enolase protein 1 (concanavalin A-like superfamily)